MVKIMGILLATDVGQQEAERGAGALKEGGCAPVLVVSGGEPVELLGAMVVPDPHWRDGLASSLKVALHEVPEACPVVVLAKAGQPQLASTEVERVIREGTATWPLGPMLLRRDDFAAAEALVS